MTKLITILMACSLALAAGVRAEQEQEKQKKKLVQQSKAAPKPQFTAKPHTATKTHVEGARNTLKPTRQIHNNANIRNSNVSKQEFRKSTAVQPNKVQSIRSEHVNFHAQPKPRIASVKFNQNYHIQGSENWRGNNYAVFQSYHPEWHDQGWWHSHYDRVVLIGGGWYYWNGGYWYPAWGYDPAAAYYPYDGPIYVGANARPPDQVVADVQSSLQQQGYYQGEVDGLLGRLTRAALARYQHDHRLYTTSAIDEPALASLGLA
jgi:putative peptidoglycan binding protein